uniref:Uncharacterized protein n=1 Tax=Arundo donax TaxID=35708 RepID=A0A0A9GJ08_ARUDO
MSTSALIAIPFSEPVMPDDNDGIFILNFISCNFHIPCLFVHMQKVNRYTFFMRN